jgi:hypothetical protein
MQFNENQSRKSKLEMKASRNIYESELQKKNQKMMKVNKFDRRSRALELAFSFVESKEGECALFR